MKALSVLMLLLLASSCTFCQSVGIGTDTPTRSAILDLRATNKGFLPPRLTSLQRDSISDPAGGLIIFNSTTNVPEYYNATAQKWTSLANMPTSTGGTTTFGPYDTVDNINRVIVMYSPTKAFGYYKDASGNGAWALHSMGASDVDIKVTISAGIVALYSPINRTAYGFTRTASGTGVWSEKLIPYDVQGMAASGNCIVYYNNLTAYAFYRNPTIGGVWVSQDFAPFGNIVAIDSLYNRVMLYQNTSSINRAYGFTINAAGNGVWTPTPDAQFLTPGPVKSAISN